MKRGKKFVLVNCFDAIKEGLKPSEISKKYNIPKTTVQYYIDGLKKKGLIKKAGYGVWELTGKKYEFDHRAVDQEVRKSKQIRGHAFIWKVRFSLGEIDWFRRLRKANIIYAPISSGRVARIIYKGRKIWLGKKGMTIYEPLDFFANSSFEAKSTAVWELDQIIRDLGRKLEINLIPYKFTTSREHYAIIKNSLARQYNEKKEKLFVYTEDRGVWMWVDFSKGVHELENQDPSINREVQNWYNDHLKHNFDVTSSFVLNGFDKLTKETAQNSQQLNHYAKHLTSHVDSVQKLGFAVEQLTEIVKEIKDKKI